MIPVLFLSLIVSVSTPSAHPYATGAWDVYEKQVRDQTLPKDSLAAMFPSIYASLPPDSSASAPVAASAESASTGSAARWKFPLAGYSILDVGKGGFQPGIRYGGSDIKGYDFFDGNRHGGHPAYDIFIRDKNRDCRDDRTGRPVAVIAPMDMRILSKEDAWRPGSGLRGGNYVWAWASQAHLLLYFAHMENVVAEPGKFVKRGDTLGTVGRTGKNAQARRSPTHLHFMVLRTEGKAPVPVDYFPLLPR